MYTYHIKKGFSVLGFNKKVLKSIFLAKLFVVVQITSIYIKETVYKHCTE